MILKFSTTTKAQIVSLAAIAFQASLASASEDLLPADSLKTRGAELKSTFTVFGGPSAGTADMLEILAKPASVKLEHGHFVGATLSHELTRWRNAVVIEGEFGAGHRSGMPKAGSSYEGWGALYFRYTRLPWSNRIRATIAISTGLNYSTRIPDAERSEKPSPPNARLLHYFSPELTLALPQHPQQQIVLRVHHRSAGYGLMWNTSAGSNAVVLGSRHLF